MASVRAVQFSNPPWRFSLSTLLIAVTISIVVINLTYITHRWALWDTEPAASIGDPSNPDDWFREGRDRLYQLWTPVLACFNLIACLAIWHAIANRKDYRAVWTGVCMSYPLLMFAGPLFLVVPLALLLTPFVGIWLIFKGDYVRGLLIIGLAVHWFLAFCLYFMGWFAVFGD